jgi:UDP-N-acetylmuramoylalanine--D-glutamate ligase
VGGKDKGADPAALVAAIGARARGVVGIGTTGPSLVRALLGRGAVPAVDGGADLDAALVAALSLARPGDAVLLSPGYSSLDQHPSFAVRGDRFAAAARRALPAAPEPSPAAGSAPGASVVAP